MYEPVVSNESDGASNKPDVQERRHNTDWNVAALVLHYKLSLYVY